MRPSDDSSASQAPRTTSHARSPPSGYVSPSPADEAVSLPGSWSALLGTTNNGGGMALLSPLLSW